MPWAHEEEVPMKRSKFSEAQIAFVLRQAEEGTSVEGVAGRRGSAKPRSMRGRRSTAG